MYFSKRNCKKGLALPTKHGFDPAPWLVIPVTSSSKYQACVNFASTMRPSCGRCPPCCPQTVCGYVHCAGVMHLLCVCAHKRILGFNIISLLGFAICVFTTNYEYANMLFLFQSRRKTQVVRRQDVGRPIGPTTIIITRQIEKLRVPRFVEIDQGIGHVY